MHPKEFLDEECANVELALNETLRHDYGFRQSHQFYTECQSRLRELRRAIEAADRTALDELRHLVSELETLAALISLIERSHLGEFSWPFADALRTLASVPCREVIPVSGIAEDPVFFISSDGGLWAYRIYPEQEAVSFSAHRRIFNIVFPRSLKHHVLLHTILGHEIGHAAWTLPSVQASLRNKVLAELKSSGPLSETRTAVAWVSAHYASHVDDHDMGSILDSWFEEFLCDLFGLLLFGPPFLAAHRTLLSTLDPKGIALGREHPPNVSRFDMVDKAVNVIGWQRRSHSLPYCGKGARERLARRSAMAVWR